MCNIRCLRSSLYTFSYTVPHTLWLTGFKSGHVVKAKLILTFLFLLAKTAFFNDITITSSLRSVAQVLMGFFYNFSVTQNVTMICAKNYEKLSKFVKIMVKILSAAFYSDTVLYTNNSR